MKQLLALIIAAAMMQTASAEPRKTDASTCFEHSSLQSAKPPL